MVIILIIIEADAIVVSSFKKYKPEFIIFSYSFISALNKTEIVEAK